MQLCAHSLRRVAFGYTPQMGSVLPGKEFPVSWSASWRWPLRQEVESLANKNPPTLHIPTVFVQGLRVFFEHQTALLVRSLYLLAVPSVVLVVWQASEDTRDSNPLFFWVYLLIWFGSFAVAGYAGWPLARTVLAAASPDADPSLHGDDWWVRDGFVRATAVFSFTVAVGTVFLVIPGLMVLMIYTFYPFLIVERKAKGFSALAASSELTTGNRMRLLGLVLILTLLFVPAGWLFYLWGPGTTGIVAMWALGAPALSVAAATMASAYRTILNT